MFHFEGLFRKFTHLLKSKPENMYIYCYSIITKQEYSEKNQSKSADTNIDILQNIMKYKIICPLKYYKFNFASELFWL